MSFFKRKTCTGKLILSTILPKPIPKSLLPILRNHGYADYSVFTQRNILKLTKEDIVIQGTFFNKSVSIYCKANQDDVDCEALAKTIVEELKEILNGN